MANVDLYEKMWIFWHIICFSCQYNYSHNFTFNSRGFSMPNWSKAPYYLHLGGLDKKISWDIITKASPKQDYMGLWPALPKSLSEPQQVYLHFGNEKKKSG